MAKMNKSGLLKHFSSKSLIKQTCIFLASLLFIFLCYFLINYTTPRDILVDQDFVIETFTDSWNKGSSVAKIENRSSNEIEYSYVLRAGVLFPYAGLLIEKRDSTYLNLTNKSLRLKICTDKKQRLPIRIFNYQEGLSDIKNVNTYRLFEKVYPIDSGYNELEISFNEFTNTPEWWYTTNKFKETDTKEIDHAHAKHISIFSDPEIPTNIKRRFTINKLELSGDYSKVYLAMGLFATAAAFIFLLAQTYIFLQKRRIHLSVKYSNDFEFGKIETKNQETLIRNYFSEHYSNSELKAADLAEHLKVPEYKISELLKENVNMSFKGFLNLTRVEAAKIYLKNSNYSISEIAYKTGFNSPSSFNRVFKEVTSISPGEFKERS
jgi:AraC-like DNA-binding protein